MKKTVTLLLISMFTLTSVMGKWKYDKKDIVKKDVEISTFSNITASRGVDVYIVKGNSNIAKIESHKDYVDHIVIKNEGNTLFVTIGDDIQSVYYPVKVYVEAETLNQIYAKSGSDIMSEEKISCDVLNIKLKSGSDAKLNIEANTIVVNASGGADLILSGTATNLKATFSGGSDLISDEMKVRNCTLKISGGSDAKIFASESINIDASGASDVKYYGNPSEKNIKTSYSSDVIGGRE
jgi:hypothetical protein